MKKNELDLGLEEPSASSAVKSSNLAGLIASVKENKEREKREKLAMACLEVYEKADKKREEMAAEYRKSKKELDDKLDNLKRLTGVLSAFEQNCDPFPLLDEMGVDRKAFCLKNGIKE